MSVCEEKPPVLVMLPGHRKNVHCRWTGLRRGVLERLAFKCEANDFNPPVAAYRPRSPGGRNGNVKLDVQSLLDYVDSRATYKVGYVASVRPPEVPIWVPLVAKAEVCPITSYRGDYLLSCGRVSELNPKPVLNLADISLPASRDALWLVERDSLFRFLRSCRA